MFGNEAAIFYFSFDSGVEVNLFYWNNRVDYYYGCWGTDDEDVVVGWGLGRRLLKIILFRFYSTLLYCQILLGVKHFSNILVFNCCLKYPT